jgi:hypothetical protein
MNIKIINNIMILRSNFFKTNMYNFIENIKILKQWNFIFKYTIGRKRIIYFNELKGKKLYKRLLYSFFIKNFIKKFFINKLEKSINNYTKNEIILISNIYIQRLTLKYKTRFMYGTRKWIGNNKYPFEIPILSAKIISDFIAYNIEINNSPRYMPQIMRLIRTWQVSNYHYKIILQRMFNSKKNLNFFKAIYNYGKKKFPLLGLRIECSGTPKKGKRKKKWFYGDIIRHYPFLSGKAPNNSFSSDLDYYQSYTTTLSSSIGIKVWCFYKTHWCNINGKVISLILTE